MSEKLNAVLIWVEKIAASVVIAVPAIRRIAAELNAAKSETTLVESNDED